MTTVKVLKCGGCPLGLEEAVQGGRAVPRRFKLRCAVTGEFRTKGKVCMLTAQSITNIIHSLSGVLKHRIDQASLG